MNNTSYQFTSEKPNYGVNYSAGYIGFTFDDDSFISNGIAYCTRWDNLFDIPVSHALIVTGENTCVEALMGKGVKRDSLDRYFLANHTHVFFRKPKDLTDTVINEIIRTADKEVGAKYADDLIVMDFLKSTFVGHMLDIMTHEQIFNAIAMMLEKKGEFICSELASYCLQSAESWAYRQSGVLSNPAANITPQELFCDETIFEQWKKVNIHAAT